MATSWLSEELKTTKFGTQLFVFWLQLEFPPSSPPSNVLYCAQYTVYSSFVFWLPLEFPSSSPPGIAFTFTEALVGGAAIDATGVPLPDATLDTCKASDAVLLAAIGG